MNALDYAESVGAECLQFFAKSPRQWRGGPVDTALAAAFVDARAERGFGPVFSHTAYLINLSTSDDELREKSTVALADELVRGALLQVDGVVTHIGNDRDGDPGTAAERVARAISTAFEMAARIADPPRLLLENTAGAGASFGASFEQLAACVAATGFSADRLGLCLDTCHGFAAGMALDSEAGWRDCLDGISACCGIDRLGLVHCNDCLFERGSKRDRHAWIGDGFIGLEGFSAMMCMPELAQVPLVTEMPGDPPEKDAINNERLRALRDACGPSHTEG